MSWKILRSLCHSIDMNIVFAQNSICTHPKVSECGSIPLQYILIFAVGRNIDANGPFNYRNYSVKSVLQTVLLLCNPHWPQTHNSVFSSTQVLHFCYICPIPDCFFPCLFFVSPGKVWSKISRQFFPSYLHFSFKWLVVIRRCHYHLYFAEKEIEAQIAYTNWKLLGVLSVLEIYSTFYKPIVQLFTLTLVPSNVSD